MQLKPRFESYKIVEKHLLFTDDLHNEIYLTIFEVQPAKNSMEVYIDTYKFCVITSGNSITYSNKSIGYNEKAITLKSNTRNLLNGIYCGIHITEIETRLPSNLDKDKYICTRFTLKMP